MKNQNKEKPVGAYGSLRNGLSEGPFSLTKRLSGEQCRGIDKALRKHRIVMDDLSFSSLCDQVERTLEIYLVEETDKRKNKISLPEFKRDAKRILKALQGLDVRSRSILDWCSLHTEGHKKLEEIVNVHDLFQALNKSLNSNQQFYTGAFDFSISLLVDACELALKAPPIDINGSGDVVKNSVSKSGRPTPYNKRHLVRSLAGIFSSQTGRKATDTESGPFDDFVSACLSVVIPKFSAASNRKIIRSVLNDMPKNLSEKSKV